MSGNVRNGVGEVLQAGQVVDRLDRYKNKVGGRIHAIDRARGLFCVLVRWPGLDDEWCDGELLMPRVSASGGSGS